MVHLYGSTRQYLIGVRLPRRRTVSWVIPPRLVKTIQSCVQTIEDLGQTFHRLVMLVDDFLHDESLKGGFPMRGKIEPYVVHGLSDVLVVKLRRRM